MSRLILERSIRAFVSRGSGLPQSQVIQGRTTAKAPDGLYASVTMIDEMPMGYQGHQQRIGETESFTISTQLYNTTFDVQFYRDGAIDAANRFAMWARSETGITWAATSLTCGRLAGVNVYDGGSGYSASNSCTFPHDADDPTPHNTAEGLIETDGRTGIRAITLNKAGSNYSTLPRVVVSGNGVGMSAAPRGYGFATNRIRVRNLSLVESSEYEERAQIDLDISHSRVYNDVHSGRVERLIGDVDGQNLVNNIIGSVPVGGIKYVYQKNLYPVDLDPSSVTKNEESHTGIGLNRLSDWLVNGVLSTGSNGFYETNILNEATIAPQYGRDVIATSPFVTNYEGNILITSAPTSDTTLGTASESAIVFLKTTHIIQGMPNNIVSIRAFWNPLSIAVHDAGANTSTITTSIDLSRFNSIVMLNTDQPAGGVIGLQISIGIGIMTNRTGTQVLNVVKSLNQNTAIDGSLDPVPNLNLILNGNNTRVTFWQSTLADE